MTARMSARWDCRDSCEVCIACPLQVGRGTQIEEAGTCRSPEPSSRLGAEWEVRKAPGWEHKGEEKRFLDYRKKLFEKNGCKRKKSNKENGAKRTQGNQNTKKRKSNNKVKQLEEGKTIKRTIKETSCYPTIELQAQVSFCCR